MHPFVGVQREHLSVNARCGRTRTNGTGVVTKRYLSEGQSGAPDAEPSHMSKTGHVGTHRPAYDAASPGDRSVSSRPA